MTARSIVPMPRRAVLYCRISRATGDDLSIDRQVAECREMAERHGLEVITQLVDDGISAWDLRKVRPAYRELLEMMRSGQVDVVVTWARDRLHRRSIDLSEYVIVSLQHDVVTYTVAGDGAVDLSTPEGVLQAQVAAAVAEYESTQKGKRVKAQKRQAAAAGKWRGGIRPFGFEPDGVTVRESEAELLRDATEAVLAGSSVRSVAARWNAEGHTTSTGLPFKNSSVRELLVRARNAGIIEIDRQPAGKAVWPAIVPEARWRACRAFLLDPARRDNQPGPKAKYLLSGIAMCDICGAPTFVLKSGSKDRRSYTCRDSRAHISRTVEPVDEIVRTYVRARLALPDARDLLVRREDNEALEHARSTLQELRAREAELGRMFALGQIGGDALASGSAQIKQQRAGLEATVDRAADRSALGWLARAADPVEAFDAAGLERRRAVISALVDVRIKRGRRGRPAGWKHGDPPYIDPETVVVTPKGAVA